MKNWSFEVLIFFPFLFLKAFDRRITPPPRSFVQIPSRIIVN